MEAYLNGQNLEGLGLCRDAIEIAVGHGGGVNALMGH